MMLIKTFYSHSELFQAMDFIMGLPQEKSAEKLLKQFVLEGDYMLEECDYCLAMFVLQQWCDLHCYSLKFSVNFLIVECLKRYHYFYGDDLKVECPHGSGKFVNLNDAALEIETRMTRLFLPDENGRRPCNGN